MRSRKLSLLLSAVMLIGLIAGCAAPAATTGSTAAEEPAATVEATEAAAEAAPAGPFEPMSYAADNCDYGGEFKSIEAVDAKTVKFTLCYPDVAFPAKVAFSAFAHQRCRLSAGNGRRRRPDREAQRHRPLQAGRMAPRRPDDLRAQRRLLGRHGHRRRTWSSAGAPRAPSAWSSCRQARSTVSTTSARMTSPRSKATPTCSCPCAAAPTSSTSA